MSDPIYANIRIGNSGPDVEGTIGHVLTKVAGGVQFQAPGAGAGGTPLTKCAWVDAAAPAGGNGFNSLEKAFNSIQDAIDAGFTTLLIAPGNYAAAIDLSAVAGGQFYFYSLGGPIIAGTATTLGNILISGIASLMLQNCSVGDITDAGVSGPAIVLIDSAAGTITGSGTTSLLSGSAINRPLSGSNVIGAIVAMGGCDLAYTLVVGNIACTDLRAQFVAGVGVAGSGRASLVQDCTFSGGLVFGGAGLSTIRNTTIVGACTFDLLDARDSTLNSVGGDAGGGMVFRTSVLTGTIGNPVSWDNDTELVSLGAGCVLNGDFVKGIGIGQGADADIQTGNANLNWNGRLRSIYARNSLSGNAAVDFSLAGAVAGQLQTYALDVWNTAHTISVTFASAPVVTIAPRAVGQGTRYLFQVNSGETAVVLLGSRELKSPN